MGPIFIGGTSSHAGKSWMATAICARLRELGVRVAPFKAQNMSNNSYPCRGGGEIGRAQVAQAEACGLEPEPAMNPILLKPTGAGQSQVILHGKLWKTLSARDYYAHFDVLLPEVLSAYQNLASRFDVVVLEGAGSVTEMNLQAVDLVNLRLVEILSAPWLLVADIERGGVFASVAGTVALLSNVSRGLLRSFAVNKFRGDLSLFDDGRRMLEERAGVPCLGVFPYAEGIYLDAEDSLGVHGSAHSTCAIVNYPLISNTTDFRLLPDARWIDAPCKGRFDVVFLPGTKNTAASLAWLRERGLDRWILDQHRDGARLVGICGGFQMLGERVLDPHGMESGDADGLGLLPMETTLAAEKTTRAVCAVTAGGNRFSAYEIHLGQTRFLSRRGTPFATLEDGSPEGIRDGRIVGTYLHGAFEDAGVLRETLGIHVDEAPSRAASYAQLAAWFAAHSRHFEELYL